MKIQKDLFNSYSLTKLCFQTMQNQPEMKSSHVGLFIYIVELNNRLRWIDEFGIPSAHTMKVMKLSKPTYLKLISDLEKFGLIRCINKSKNQSQASTYSLRTDAFKSYIDKKTSKKNSFAGKEILPA